MSEESPATDPQEDGDLHRRVDELARRVTELEQQLARLQEELHDELYESDTTIGTGA